MQNQYIFLDKFSIGRILSEVINSKVKKKNSSCYKEFSGHFVNMTSQRYNLFKKKGTTCVCCGLEATHFNLEFGSKRDKRPHFNLYGIFGGKEILFTKDHIIPRSKGGTDTIDNYQTMCTTCNTKKGKREISLVDLKKEVKRR